MGKGEDGGGGTAGTDVLNISPAKHSGEQIYTTIRRFIAVKLKRGHCVCV